jgi:hypothetical protein
MRVGVVGRTAWSGEAALGSGSRYLGNAGLPERFQGVEQEPHFARLVKERKPSWRLLRLLGKMRAAGGSRT